MAGDVLLDRADGEHERLRNAGIRATLRHQGQHLELPRRQIPEWAAPRHQLRDHLRVECGAAGRDAADGVDERVDVHDPMLEQVANAAVAAPLEELARRGLR